MEETLRDLLGYWRGRAAAEVGGGTGFGRERRDP
jgi:hypothetical protein